MEENNDKFMLNKEFTSEQKIEKFDMMRDEYNRLMNYRNMLYKILTTKTFCNEFNEDGIIINKKENLSAYDLARIDNEINSLSAIISWIESVILDEPNLTKKTITNENEGTDI